jgi:hypothetical protein
VVLYLLALDAVACAMLAWHEPTPLELVGWALGLGVIQGVGEKLGFSFATIDARRRDRLGTFLGTIQLSVLVLALVLAAGLFSPGLLRFLANVLAGYQVVAMLLVRLTPQPRGLVGQSLALIALACLRGGPLAAWAAASALGLTGLYIGLEHHSRLLATHRVDEGPHGAQALWRSLVIVVPVALLVGVAVVQLDPEERRLAQPVVEEDPGYVPLDEDEDERKFDPRALRAIVLAGLAGAVAVYFVGRLLNRSKGGEPKAIETPEPLRGRLERIRPEEQRRSRARAVYRGNRGRIVRAYLNLLRGAERAGFPRHPHETAAEFAEALAEPKATLTTTTEIFVRARYGAGCSPISAASPPGGDAGSSATWRRSEPTRAERKPRTVALDLRPGVHRQPGGPVLHVADRERACVSAAVGQSLRASAASPASPPASRPSC